ncbi:MAG: hypothetical protein L6V35_00490 [Alistipes putredinis]|nr:MAG: hypothetical protein L6V35_00490 [Alistipes putredinis]
MKIALEKHLPDARLIASQVKYLQRARTKLPVLYDARCVIPSLAFEQASSQTCAGFLDCGGKLCIDLTCGLGIDAMYLARRFEKVISLERDEVLAAVARENFARLGITNIEVVNTSAEDFSIFVRRPCRPDICRPRPARRERAQESTSARLLARHRRTAAATETGGRQYRHKTIAHVRYGRGAAHFRTDGRSERSVRRRRVQAGFW